MKQFIGCLCFYLALGVSACAGEETVEANEASYDPASQRAKFVPYPMEAELGFLSAEEKQILDKLFRAADLMSEIYLRQINPANPTLRARLAVSDDPLKAAKLELFDIYFGPWDSLSDHHPFYGEQWRPPGAGFYPPDLRKPEFEQWISQHPNERKAFTSLYTVIARRGKGLVAVPYSQAYREWLVPAASLLREAAALTRNPSLARYLKLRAQGLLDDEYFTSDIAWMELEGTPIDPLIGPYEVYDDELFGYKAAFQAAITVQTPGDAADLKRFKSYLRDMEAHLPIADEHKNFRRGEHSPVILATMLYTGGYLAGGPQAMAFNLPNDERVREAKGSKNVLLKNVMQAKFDRILTPMAGHVLVPAHSRLLDRDCFTYFILFHELGHSLGPGTLTRQGETTTVAAELQELHWPLEEAKADLMGIYNLLFMMEKGEFPQNRREHLLSTYFVNLFRAMRFGLKDTYSRAAALQYHFIQAHGGCIFDPVSRRFSLDFARMEEAVATLLGRILTLQAQGDYPAAGQLLQEQAALDNMAEAVLAGLRELPVDIQPRYPARLK